MKLVTFVHEDGPQQIGALIGGGYVPLTAPYGADVADVDRIPSNTTDWVYSA